MASNMIGHMGDDTLDDPLSDRYKKIGCSISPLDKDSYDYKMILNYVEKTYEPVKLADIVSHILRFAYFSSNSVFHFDLLTKPYILGKFWSGIWDLS